MNKSIPGVYIKYHKTETPNSGDFATMFILFNDYGFDDEIITLTSFSQLSKYPSVKNSKYLLAVLEAYFANKGKKLYLFNHKFSNLADYNHFDFEQKISRVSSELTDIEVVCAPDIYLNKELKEQRDKISIQRVINLFCRENHKLSITDINDDFNYEYLDMVGESMLYYPWLLNKDSVSIPPSVYASALFSKMANEEKLATSVANKEILNAIDVEKVLNDDEKEFLIKNRINPVITIPFKGVRIWGSKTFDSRVETTSEQRIINYVKRSLFRIARPYIFEPNSNSLEDKLIMKIDGFLYKLWEKGYLKGSSKDSAFMIRSRRDNDENIDNILVISIFLALIKPVEFISIELNKVSQDGTQSTLSIN